MSVDSDAPYSLKSDAEIERRRAMLSLGHMVPLVDYAARVKIGRGGGCELPLFDPCDGGIDAKLLFLPEAPEPKAVGSSFISRNNPDRTARNMDMLLREAELPRRDCVLWNIVPWYIGDGKRIRAATKPAVADAMPYLQELLSLLSGLKAIALVGKAAASAEVAIRGLSPLPIYCSPHPSPKVFNVYPKKRDEALGAHWAVIGSSGEIGGKGEKCAFCFRAGAAIRGGSFFLKRPYIEDPCQYFSVADLASF